MNESIANVPFFLIVNRFTQLDNGRLWILWRYSGRSRYGRRCRRLLLLAKKIVEHLESFVLVYCRPIYNKKQPQQECSRCRRRCRCSSRSERNDRSSDGESHRPSGAEFLVPFE